MTKILDEESTAGDDIDVEDESELGDDDRVRGSRRGSEHTQKPLQPRYEVGDRVLVDTDSPIGTLIQAVRAQTRGPQTIILPNGREDRN